MNTRVTRQIALVTEIRGTRINWRRVSRRELQLCALTGFTTELPPSAFTPLYEIARYWAEISAWSDARDYHSDGAGCILVLRRKALLHAGYTLTKIKYDPQFAWAQEIACWSDINLKQSGVLIEVQYIPDAAKITEGERLPRRVRTPHWAAPSLPIDELLEAARKLECSQVAAEQSGPEKGIALRALVPPRPPIHKT